MATGIKNWFVKYVMTPMIGQMDKWQERVVAMPETHKSVPDQLSQKTYLHLPQLWDLLQKW